MRRLLLVMLVFGVLLVPTSASGSAVFTNSAISNARVGHAAATSTNWAGYADSGAMFTDVRASWIQPKVKCPSSARQASAFWVGLDGYDPTSTSVEQIGTDSDCNGVNKPVYYAWYEIVPAPSVPLPARDVVHPGDQMSAEVTAVGTVYTLALKNWTVGWRFSTQQTSTMAQDSSAEWVAEAPSLCSQFFCKVMPLADFGKVAFANAQAIATTAKQAATISGFSHDEIEMLTDSGVRKAQPSPLTKKGASFTVNWART